MLNRLLMAVHWVLFLWVLTWPCLIINALLGKPLAVGWVTSEIEDFLITGGVLAVVYIITLWIIKSRWIVFPWQHDKD